MRQDVRILFCSAVGGGERDVFLRTVETVGIDPSAEELLVALGLQYDRPVFATCQPFVRPYPACVNPSDRRCPEGVKDQRPRAIL